MRYLNNQKQADMTISNTHAGRGGGGRYYRKRGGRQGRGGGGRGDQEGGRGKSTPSNKAGDAAVVKQATVVVEKMNTENKSPQDPTPPAPQSVSFAKSVEDLKNVLGVGVVRTASASSGGTNNAGAQGVSSGTAADTPSEKEMMQQKLKEAREQVAAAKEKKKSKKSKKHEKWLKEQRMQQEDRAKSWTDKVNREEEKYNAISDLIGTEFRRVNKGVIINDETQKVITEKSREAHDALYGSNIKCRVEVVGSERKDLNGRKGSIRHWDENKGQFCVGLDTKKSRDCDVYFFKPENLDVVTPAQSASKKDGKLAANFIVSITGITTQGGDGIACQFSLKKSDITKLESAHSRSKGLQEFFEERDALAHRLMKEQEEQRKEEERLEKEEEEDRKRRAEIKAKKRAEKELKKEEQRRRRENAFKRSQEKAKREKATEIIHELQISIRKAVLTQKVGAAYEAYFRMWASDGGSLEDFEEFKNEFKEKMFDRLDDDFPFDLDDILEEIFDETDEQFKEVLKKDRLEEDKKHAAILGVSHDVDKRTLQKIYRKLALQYHPDKWSASSASSHGMCKEEAEEHFKNIRNSYDHLMANFDE